MARRFTQSERDAAITAYIANGPAYVEAEFGVKAGTVRQWATRNGVTLGRDRKAEQADRAERVHDEWAIRRTRLANRSGEVAEAAIDRAAEAIAASKPHDAAAYGRVYAILVDKAQLLSGAATSRTENVETLRGEADEIMRELEEQAR